MGPPPAEAVKLTRRQALFRIGLGTATIPSLLAACTQQTGALNKAPKEAQKPEVSKPTPTRESQLLPGFSLLDIPTLPMYIQYPSNYAPRLQSDVQIPHVIFEGERGPNFQTRIAFQQEPHINPSPAILGTVAQNYEASMLQGFVKSPIRIAEQPGWVYSGKIGGFNAEFVLFLHQDKIWKAELSVDSTLATSIQPKFRQMLQTIRPKKP